MWFLRPKNNGSSRFREMATPRDEAADQIRYKLRPIFIHYIRLATTSDAYTPLVGESVTSHLKSSIEDWVDDILTHTIIVHRYMATTKLKKNAPMASAYYEALGDLTTGKNPLTLDYRGDWTGADGTDIDGQIDHGLSNLPQTPELNKGKRKLKREMMTNIEWSYPLLDFLQTKVIVNGKVNDNMVEDMAELLSVFHD